VTGQEVIAAALGVAALAYLVVRWRRRRATGNCCGEPECPAAKQVVDRLDSRP
jgi:hypothetical protein